jgi:hypothetical protein
MSLGARPSPITGHVQITDTGWRQVVCKVVESTVISADGVIGEPHLRTGEHAAEDVAAGRRTSAVLTLQLRGIDFDGAEVGTLR